MFYYHGIILYIGTITQALVFVDMITIYIIHPV